MQLSAACHTLRCAAEAAALAGEGGVLDIHAGLPAQHLSPLLARLCRGFAGLGSGADLLASPQAAAFLAAAGTRSVAIEADDLPAERQAALAAAVGWCTVKQLACTVPDPSCLPAQFSSALEGLDISFSCTAHGLTLRQVFASLPRCPSLEDLRLTFCREPAPLPASLSWPPSLQRLHLRFGGTTGTCPVELGLLGTAHAARRSISLLLDAAPFSANLRVLRAVPCSSSLEQLGILPHGGLPNHAQPTLSQVQSRRCLVRSWSSCLLDMLPRAQHLTLNVHAATVSWHLLAGSARCIAVPLYMCQRLGILLVEGCIGDTPDHAQPWALFVQDFTSVPGLPRHHFVQLPSGWWAWRNGAAIAQGLDRPVLCDSWMCG